MASSPQKNLQFISPPKEAGDFLQNQVKVDKQDLSIIKWKIIKNIVIDIIDKPDEERI